MNVFFTDRFFLERRAKVALEVFDAFVNHVLRGACAGRDENGLDAREPLILDLGNAVDQVRRDTQPVGDLGEPSAVRAVLTAENQHHVRLGDELLHCVLAVLRRVADVVLVRPDHLRVLPLQCVDDGLRLVYAERRLRQEGQLAFSSKG